MPLLSIETNASRNAESVTQLTQSASKLVAEILGKPESYVMVKLTHNPNMIFGGSNERLVYAELKSLGLPEDQTENYSERLTRLFIDELKVTADRIYIEFSHAERHMWGWNGTTF